MKRRNVHTAIQNTTEDGPEYFSLPISDPIGARFRVDLLFYELTQHLGEQEARKLFQGALSKRASGRRKNWEILRRLDQMKPKASPWKLACQIAEENKKTKRYEDKLGPRGSIEPKALERHIHRLMRERERGIKDGTWHGPGGPVRPITGVIRVKIIE